MIQPPQNEKNLTHRSNKSLRFVDSKDTVNFSILVTIVSSLAFGLIILIFLAKRSEDMGISGSFPIPKYDQLLTATGTLKDPMTFGSRALSWDIGQLVISDDQIMGFSCQPGGADGFLDCLYSDTNTESKLHDRMVRIKYFKMNGWLYPAYSHGIRTSHGDKLINVPREPAAIVMEIQLMGDKSSTKILEYDDSVNRIKRYMRGHPGF
jgi:hypothetical protein